jgi:hypothetical protein
MIDLIQRIAPLADQFNRPITYLRISVTDRCNLRCVYCMPEAGLPWIEKAEILTFEEIETIVRAAAAIGVRSIRLTGGEPLVRRDLPRYRASRTSRSRRTGYCFPTRSRHYAPPVCGGSTFHSIRCSRSASLRLRGGLVSIGC